MLFFIPPCSDGTLLKAAISGLWTLESTEEALASYPGSWWVERKRAWYLLFTHVHNYLLLNMCSGKSGRGNIILTHVIDSVTYDLASMLV